MSRNWIDIGNHFFATLYGIHTWFKFLQILLNSYPFMESSVCMTHKSILLINLIEFVFIRKKASAWILDIESYLGNCVCLPLECEDFIKIIGSTTIKIFPWIIYL